MCRQVIDPVIEAGCHGVISAGSMGEFFVVSSSLLRESQLISLLRMQLTERESRNRMLAKAIDNTGQRGAKSLCGVLLGWRYGQLVRKA